MNAATLEALRHDAAAGKVQAMTALGLRLLGGIGTPSMPAEGADWLSAAAARGDGSACARLAVLAATGVCRPQDWEAAFDLLQRSAELGWEPARSELTLLASAPAEVGSGVDRRPPAADLWQRLRRRIDIRAWTTVPPKQSLFESPRIRRIEGFVSAAVCDWLIRAARDRLERARTYDSSSGRGLVDESRTNREADFGIVQADLVLSLVRARIAVATGLPTSVMEPGKVLHYAVGQRFAPHFDFIDPAVPALAGELRARGQRLATFLVYLNDDYDGGETEFPELGLRHRGRRGDALMFANVDLAGQPERRSLHQGLAPTRGEKWLLSQWIRDRTPALPSPGPGG